MFVLTCADWGWKVTSNGQGVVKGIGAELKGTQIHHDHRDRQTTIDITQIDRDKYRYTIF